MSNDLPPGSGKPGSGDDPQDPLSNMFSQLFGGAGIPGGFPEGFDPAQLAANFPGGEMGLQQMMAQVQRMMASPSDQPVNWELAMETARKVAAAQPDPMPADAVGRAARDTLVVAGAWLDEVTSFENCATLLQTWSKAEWVESTMTTWQELAGPVASSVADAMGKAITEQAPPEMAAMVGQASGMLRNLSGGVFGTQLGQAVGTLAGDVLTSFDIGLPLTDDLELALMPHNIAQFADGLEVPESDVMLYLTLREAAHHRLYSHATWLRGLVFEAIASYARGVNIDTQKIESAMSGIDPTNPEAMTEALQGGLLQPDNSPAQEAALERLELLLALIEGWVDHIVHEAAATKMPTASALRETMRRRRAAGGPAEHTLASLVGLKLRPRKLREAAALWEHLLGSVGAQGRDGIWDHPDLLPRLADLADPAQAAQRLTNPDPDNSAADLDDEFRKLLAETNLDTTGTDPDDSPDQDPPATPGVA